jgi:hypothetical protein
MWNREMDCLLSICEYIVEFSPAVQAMPDGSTHDVMPPDHQSSETLLISFISISTWHVLLRFMVLIPTGDGDFTKIRHPDEPSRT